MARELVILPRVKRDFRSARKHPEFEPETLEYIFEVMISGATLPEAFREHRLDKGTHDQLFARRTRRRDPVPNRYGLPAFYEIHVWAWQDNPKGSYADWNTRVTCTHQAD